MRPQQRPARDSRQLSKQRPPYVQGLWAVIVQLTTHSVGLQIYGMSFPPALTYAAGKFTLIGKPQVLREAEETFPTVAAFDNDSGLLVLTYAGAPIDHGENFYIGPQDPAIRAPDGSYLAPARLTAP